MTTAEVGAGSTSQGTSRRPAATRSSVLSTAPRCRRHLCPRSPLRVCKSPHPWGPLPARPPMDRCPTRRQPFEDGRQARSQRVRRVGTPQSPQDTPHAQGSQRWSRKPWCVSTPGLGTSRPPGPWRRVALQSSGQGRKVGVGWAAAPSQGLPHGDPGAWAEAPPDLLGSEVGPRSGMGALLSSLSNSM